MSIVNNTSIRLNGEYDPQTQRYTCPEPGCSQKHTMRWRSNDHVLQHHCGIKPYPCPECLDAGFASRQRLEDHIRHQHYRDRERLLQQVKAVRHVNQIPHLIISYGPLGGEYPISNEIAPADQLYPQSNFQAEVEQEANANHQVNQAYYEPQHRQSMEQHTNELNQIQPEDEFDSYVRTLLTAENQRMDDTHAAQGEIWNWDSLQWVPIAHPQSPQTLNTQSSVAQAPHTMICTPPQYIHGVAGPLLVSSTGNSVRETFTGVADAYPAGQNTYFDQIEQNMDSNNCGIGESQGHLSQVQFYSQEEYADYMASIPRQYPSYGYE